MLDRLVPLLVVAALLSTDHRPSVAQSATHLSPKNARAVSVAGSPRSAAAPATVAADRAERVAMHPSASAAVGRTALCGDGTFAVNESRSRSCAGRGGVAGWTDGSLDVPAPVGKCRDGSSWYNSARGSACRGHGGVASWLVKR